MLLLISILLIVTFLVWLLHRPFYWSGKGIKYILPWPILGNYGPLFRKGHVMFLNELYNRFPEEKLYGFHSFSVPSLLIRDPDLFVEISVKQFDHFADNGLWCDSKYDLTGQNIFFLKGQQWKAVKSKVSPFFTPSKVKSMLAPAVSSTMVKAEEILDKLSDRGEPCEVSNIFCQIGNDVITQAVFGMHSDVFKENSQFLPMADVFFSRKTNLMYRLKSSAPWLFRLLRLQSFDFNGVVFLKSIVKDLVDYRKQHNVKGNDFVQGIIEIMDKYQSDDGIIDSSAKTFADGTRVPKFDFEEMFLQAFVIFLGGIDSTATLMSWLFYYLALDQDVQDRCRNEIQDFTAQSGRNINIEDVNELPYLTAAIKETMRMNPPFFMISRKCTDDFHLEEYNLTIKRGTPILFPTSSVQRDPKYFADPDVFDPDRFVGEEPKSAGLFTGFGIGPKMCLGKSFAMYETILVVSRLLEKYKFRLNRKTPIPLLPMKGKIIYSPASPVWLDLEKL